MLLLLLFLTGFGQRAPQKPYSKYAKGFSRLSDWIVGARKYSLTELLAYL